MRQPAGYTTAHHNGGSGFRKPWPSYQASSVSTLLKARWSTPKNFVPVTSLPEVDAVCISHDHYDYLDSDTLSKLNAKNKLLRYFCALGVKSVLTGLGIGIRDEQVTEMDWWDGISLKDEHVGSVELICTPAQHRSGRAPWNFDGTLWCSWATKEPGDYGKRLFFAGDTGYCHINSDAQFSHHDAPHPPCPAFKEVGELHGPFDLALLPAGCFKPRSGQHSSPEDSLAIHRDMRSKKSIAMHYGTFRGAYSAPYEPVTEPVERRRKGAEAEGLNWDEVGLCDDGETVVVSTYSTITIRIEAPSVVCNLIPQF